MSFNAYGLLIAVALAIAAWHGTREEKRLGLPKDLGVEIVLYSLPPALVVSRLYFVVFRWDQFKDNLVSALYLWEGGLAIYGAVIGGALGIWRLSRRRKVSFAVLADIVAPVLLLGQAIGRWGNYINQEAHGWQVLDPRLQWMPLAVPIGENWFLAAFFYEFLWNLFGAAFLYLNRKRWQQGKTYGHVFLWYLVWYGTGRLVVEGVRTDSLMLGPVRVSQALSLLLCAVGLLALMKRLRVPRAWYLLPFAAIIAPLAIPGWWGIGIAFVLFTAAGGMVYAFTRRKAA